MAFTQSTRVWWDSAKPGAGTSQLKDATPSAGTPSSPSEDTGTEGLRRGRLVVCARSGFVVPLSETVLDPNTGARVWNRFADKQDPLDRERGIPPPVDRDPED